LIREMVEGRRGYSLSSGAEDNAFPAPDARVSQLTLRHYSMTLTLPPIWKMYKLLKTRENQGVMHMIQWGADI
jgi:hypothetical protein